MAISFDKTPDAHNNNDFVGKSTILWFGKHKGRTIKDVLQIDPKYLEWCLETKKFKVLYSLETEIEEAVEAWLEGGFDDTLYPDIPF